MTNSDDDKNQLPPRSGRRWWRLLLLSGTGLGVLGLIGAMVAQAWVREKLAPIVESEVSQTLKRPIKIGRLERFSPTSLRFGRSTLPELLRIPIMLLQKQWKYNFQFGLCCSIALSN